MIRRRWLALFLILSIMASLGSLYLYRHSGDVLHNNDVRASIVFGGLTRTYIVHTPKLNGTAPIPLVLAFHGGGGTGAGMARLTHLSQLADKYGFIVAYPDGYMRRWADGRGTTAAERAGVDDVGFVSALIDQLSKQNQIDPTRVYATGISNGGFFSLRLACELSSKITAVAAVAATLPQNLSDHCHPQKPVSILLIHGTDDPLVPASGGVVGGRIGGEVISLNATVNLWLQADACMLTPDVTYATEVVNDGTRVKIETFASCKNSSAVILYVIEGVGHTWPGGVQFSPESVIGKTTHNIDAGQVIWLFFQKHSLNA